MDNSNSSPVTPTGAQGASPSNPTASSPSNVVPNSPNSFSATSNTAGPSGAAASSAGSLGSSGIPAGGIGSASLGLNGDDEPIQTRMADQQAAAEFQQAHPNRTTSSAGRGAIKLTNDNPKSNKKWLFIALGAAAVLVVIGVVVAMVVNSVRQSNPSSNLSAEASFNQFANYILYGTDSAAPLEGEFDYWQDYKLDEEVAKSPIDEEWWERGKELLARTINNYPEPANAVDEEKTEEQINQESLADFLQNYQTDFLDLYEYAKIPALTVEDIVKQYARTGQLATENYINNFFEVFSERGSEELPLYITARQSHLKSILSVLPIYEAGGCQPSEDGIYQNECIEMLVLDEAQKEMVYAVDDNLEHSVLSLQTSIRNIENNAWLIEKMFRPEADDEEAR